MDRVYSMYQVHAPNLEQPCIGDGWYCQLRHIITFRLNVDIRGMDGLTLSCPVRVSSSYIDGNRAGILSRSCFCGGVVVFFRLERW